MIKKIKIDTERFLLRNLELTDATQRYSDWFQDVDTKRYIESAKNKNDLDALRDYIRRCQHKEDIVFLGIFTKKGVHIGNIKYEPVNISKMYAVMGILIGDTAWRGKGVAAEAILSSAHYLNNHYGIKKIYLGVSGSNVAAVNAYRKIGFTEQATPEIIKPSAVGVEMVLFL